jgi:hypothetical protein
MGLRRTLAGALTAPVLLVTTACGGNDTSVADPPISPHSSSSSPTSPQRESPEHFIRRWAAAEKAMENTGEAGAYLRISSKCRACRELAADVTRYYAAGGMIRWGGWRFLTLRAEGTDGQAQVFIARVESAPTRYRTSASSPLKRLPGGTSTHQLTIREAAGKWHMLVKARVSS